MTAHSCTTGNCRNVSCENYRLIATVCSHFPESMRDNSVSIPSKIHSCRQPEAGNFVDCLPTTWNFLIPVWVQWETNSRLKFTGNTFKSLESRRTSFFLLNSPFSRGICNKRALCGCFYLKIALTSFLDRFRSSKCHFWKVLFRWPEIQ